MWKKAVLFLVLLSVRQCRPKKPLTEKSDGNGNKKPHIIFMLADDYGWNDVGFHNEDILTPTLDCLANDGIILNQSYVQNLCTPSRAALMTGYYPFRTGMQNLVIPFNSPMGLPLQFELLPEKLKKMGYVNHMVGKWHLGSCSPAYFPLNRGFDSFFGYLNGGQYYYDHSTPFLSNPAATATIGVPNIYDFWNQSTVAWNYRGTYSSIPFVKQVEILLGNLDPEDPVFLYLPFQLTHSPLQVPKEKLSLYPNIENFARKRFSGMVSQMDSDVANIINALKKYDFYKDSIIIFTADNGGEVSCGGNNYPLKGSKHTLWEGGHRAAAFVHSPLLEKKGYTYNGMIHIVDWFATILKLAGGEPDDGLDGKDVWPAITKNEDSPRTEFVYHLENNGNNVTGAIRVGNWKLIVDKAGLPNYAVPPNNVTGLLANTPGGNIFFKDIPDYPSYRLFDLKNDPTENNNLASANQPIVDQLRGRIDFYKKQMVYPTFRLNDMVGYRAKNNLTSLGLNWCEPIAKVQLIDWTREVHTDPLPF